MVFAACALLALVAMIYVVYVQPDTRPAPARDAELDYLVEKKTVLYDNLRDLNLEYRMGKLSDADYQRLKQQCQFEIGGVLAQIESSEVSAPPPAAARDRVTAQRRAASPPAKEIVCPRCGNASSSRNRFCGECGEKLTAVIQEPEQ